MRAKTATHMYLYRIFKHHIYYAVYAKSIVNMYAKLRSRMLPADCHFTTVCTTLLQSILLYYSLYYFTTVYTTAKLRIY